MLAFTVKKAFFDLWDNFLPSVLVNLGAIVVLIFPLTLPFEAATRSIPLAYLLLGIGVILIFVYAGAAAAYAESIINHESFEWSAVPGYFKRTWKVSVFFALATYAIWFLLGIAVPTYAGMGSVLGSAAMALLLWSSLLWFLSSQYIFPAALQTNCGFRKAVKKSFLLFFDNTGFTLFLFFGSLVALGISVLTAFLFPGLMGILIWHQTGLKLRLYKYDYLEEHPDTPRGALPWDALLKEEREILGKRTFKNTIFPWKD